MIYKVVGRGGYSLSYFWANTSGRKPNTRLRLTMMAAERIFSIKTSTIFGLEVTFLVFLFLPCLYVRVFKTVDSMQYM